jgi:hypothetical protein
MVVEDQLDGGIGRVGGIEPLEEANELARPMAVLNRGVDLSRQRSIPASRLSVPWRLYPWSRAKLGCDPGCGGRSGAVLSIAWMPGFSS